MCADSLLLTPYSPMDNLKTPLGCIRGACFTYSPMSQLYQSIRLELIPDILNISIFTDITISYIGYIGYIETEEGMGKAITVRFSDEDYETLKKAHFEYCQQIGELISLNQYMVMRLLNKPQSEK